MMVYGVGMMMIAITAVLMFWYIAFQTDCLNDSISMKSRKNYLYKTVGGPILYAVAIWLSFVNVNISVALYIIVPLLYVVLPKSTLEIEND